MTAFPVWQDNDNYVRCSNVSYVCIGQYLLTIPKEIIEFVVETKAKCFVVIVC